MALDDGRRVRFDAGEFRHLDHGYVIVVTVMTGCALIFLVAPSFVFNVTAHAADERRRDSLFLFHERSNRLPPEPPLDNTDSNDIKLADVDHDGDLDIFIAQGTASIEGRQNRLLINNSSGRFTEETETRLPVSSATSTHVDFGDVEGDENLDAIIAVAGPEQLLLNDGQGVFVDVSLSHLPPSPPLLQDITLS